MTIRAFVLALCLLGISLGAAVGQGSGKSDDDLAKEIAADQRISKTGVKFGEPILIQVGDAVFRVPAVYLPLWPTPDMVGKINYRNGSTELPPGFGFEFRMPSRRPIETKVLPPPPVPGQFFVWVSFVLLVKPNDPGYLFPERQFANSRSVDGGPDDRYEEKFGLQEVIFGRERKDIALLHYRNVPGRQPQFWLRCTPPRDPAPNPWCDGTVYFESDELTFRIAFARHHVAEWEEIMKAVRDLVVSWRQQ